MKLKETKSNWEPAPEGTHRAVCVDWVIREKVATAFGERDLASYVFEIEALRDDGAPFTVRTRGMTPSLNEKANLRKMYRGWFGRELTAEELGGFDPESMIGRPAQLVIVHEHRDGETYSNIMACLPHKNGEALQPSGRYVRIKDRPPRDASSGGPRGGYLQERQLAASAAARLCDTPGGPTAVGDGGARGGGKSHWLLAQMGADDCMRVPGLKCLLLRKVGKANMENFEDLRRRLFTGLKHEFSAYRGVLTFGNPRP